MRIVRMLACVRCISPRSCLAAWVASIVSEQYPPAHTRQQALRHASKKVKVLRVTMFFRLTMRCTKQRVLESWTPEYDFVHSDNTQDQFYSKTISVTHE
ncbi:hypothetical protein BKA93DRAFT_795675 [Sparassis latifolia]